MINKIIPLLSKYLPPALAIQGLNKINPKMSKFIGAATAAGYGTDSIMDYLRDQFESPALKSEKSRLEQGASQGNLRPDQMSNLNRMQQIESGSNIPSVAIGLGAGSIYSGLRNQNQVMQEEQENLESNQQMQPQQNIIQQYSPELHQFIEDQINAGRSALEAGALAQLDSKYKKVIQKMEQDHKTPFSSILESTYANTQPKGQPQQQPQQGSQGQQALLEALQRFQQLRGKK